MDTATDTPPRRRGPKLPELVLTDDERATLQRWARRARSGQALALRYNQLADGKVQKGEEVLAAAAAGDRQAIHVVRTAGDPVLGVRADAGAVSVLAQSRA